ncbi:KAP family P-loop NTPase fold protein [Neisseria flavescens]|jgi:KAP family P-loop domain-containing protein|uniref:KAP family P-loop NTPase fold protein n=1 Tax=Neisseria TaxID=482 RepID=UPI00124104EC|nr:KAP family NTPase [Neisseria flavescens]
METQSLEKTFATHDEFNRKPIAENIIRLLTSPIDLSPMVIDGGWGTGKTEFCQKLVRLMQQHPNFQPVYIDAFRSDHSGEPLLALLAEIIKTCTPEDTDGQPSEKRKSFTNRIAKVAGFGIKTIFKAAMGHVLKQNTDDLAEELQQIMNDDQEARSVAETVTDTANIIANHTIDVTVEALLKEQIEAEKNLETLKSCMKELAEDKPIILFIDELDRCRPDYAVDMLEVIKHVFDIENVKVVLVTNTKQLCAAINHRYGAEVDAQKYLDKFLKYSFALPDKVLDQNEAQGTIVAVQYFEPLLRNSRIFNELKELIENEKIKNFTCDMIKRTNISLRETERLVRFLEIYHSLSGGLSNKVRWENILLVITGIFIFCFHPELIKNINENHVAAGDPCQLFNFQILPKKPMDESNVNYADVIAMMFIMFSKVKDPTFVFRISDDQEYWQMHVNNLFLRNVNLDYCGIDGVFSVLKNTFRVLSLERMPQ